MKLSLLVLYVPEPTLDRAGRFYGAILDAEPVAEKHNGGPQHWSVTSTETGLVMELYPMGSRPPTATRLEFRGPHVDDAVQRLIDRAFALPEKTKDGKGWWVTDPIGNTVVLLRGA